MRFLGIFVTVFLFTSCASAKKIPKLPFEKRIYVSCEKEQIDPPEGKLCFNQCVARYLISKKCYEWFLDVMPFKENHQKFYNWEFRMVK